MDFQAAALSLRAIGAGFTALAAALETENDAESTPNPGSTSASESPPGSEAPPSKAKKKDKAPPPEPEEDAVAEEEAAEATLEGVQKKGRDLLAAGKRSELRAILERFDLPNLSSAKPKQFAKLDKALKEAIDTE